MSLPGPRWLPSALRVTAVGLVVGGAALALTATGHAAPARSQRPVWGFLPNWDPAAMVTLQHHARQLTVVLPTGPTLGRDGALLGHVGGDVVRLAHSRGVRVVPVVSDYLGGWNSGSADRMLRRAALRARFTTAVAGAARAGGWDGVNLDLEALRARDRAGLVRLVRSVRAALGPGADVSVDVPAGANPAYDLRALGAAASHVVLMAYDQHATPGAPGPVATPAWVAGAARHARSLMPAGRLVVGLPTYSSVWRGRSAPASSSFEEALQRARAHGTLPQWSARGQAPWFTTGFGRHRTVTWMSDALTLAADMRAAGPAGTPVALWRLGAEDSGVWPVLADRTLAGAGPAGALSTIPAPDLPRVTGSGDVVHAVAGAPGWRRVAPGLTAERFWATPRAWKLERWSGGGKRVAITFDDGPSATWTPLILAQLRRLHVPATFFVIGKNAAANPGLVSAEVAAGDLVGNHTFSHPNLAVTGGLRTRLEITTTSRIIAGITGRRPTMFRAPYSADTAPSSPRDLIPLLRAQGLGMQVVGASVDSQDYRRPSPQRIVQNVLRGLHQGNILLFHDGGGNRANTVAALPMVVSALRARGYHLVSVAQLLRASPATLMPRVTGTQLWLSRSVAWAAEGWFLMTRWVALLGIGLLGLLLLRSLLLAVLAVRHRRRGARPLPGPPPAVTVLVPAFNEATVIRRTLESLLAQRGVTPEIIVIDDGSTDGTAEAAAMDGVRVVRQANAGKWAALNRGFMAASGEVVVAIDADTVIDPDAVRLLARWFTDPAIGAVCGTAKVGNRHTLVTLWQHVEYTTGFNLDRRAYSDLNAITVVPGAIGGWRRDAVVAAGGYSGRTLAEDCDLTITLRRRGWRVVHEPAAVAWTEAPETLRGLAKQRLRWTFGTFQVLWVNRDALFRRREGALGWLALPYAWLYQCVLSLLGPAVDLLVLLALLTGGWTLALWWFGLATLTEMGVSWLAFRLEGERAWPVLTLPLQRVVYRQLMYATVIRSLLRAARGSGMAWGKLARTGTVRAG